MLFRSNDTATTEIYTLSLHDALPIFVISNGKGAIISMLGPTVDINVGALTVV